MELWSLIIIVALLLLNTVVTVLVMRRFRAQPQDERGLTLLNQNVQGMQHRLDAVSKGMNDRLDNAARVIGAVNKELGGLQEIGRNMRGLQDFLSSPKLRGGIGEQVLEQMLEQYFPSEMYEIQYHFRDGQVVDSIVRTENGIIPIDAKFPMENYQKMVRAETEDDRAAALHEFMKDVKKHVNDIARKYILPGEGTVDFALMYIPSEAVYYEVIRHDDELHLHGIEKSVLFVSPNSFYYFLRVLLMGMQGKRMEDATKELVATIKGIQKDATRFGESLQVLNSHITHAKSAMERASTDYAKLEGKIERVDELEESTRKE